MKRKNVLTLWSLLLLVGRSAHAQEAAPAGPIIVAQDGTGTYRTVQEAVNAIPNQVQAQVVIRVKKGTYREKLVVPALKTHISLVGEDKNNTIITYDDHTGKGDINTYTSHSVLVQGNDFRAENITFENTAGYTAGQAVALHVEADRCVFKNCRMVGNQDVLFLATDNSRQYYQDCYIEGTTDFIFGASTAVFDHCTIYSKKNSYITAASTPAGHPYGFVFLHCKLLADSTRATQVHLGRPWRPSARVVFLHTEMDRHIVPAGWHNWNKPESEKLAYYAEYKSTGPGANPQSRVPWSHQLTAKEAKLYTLKQIFGGPLPWDPTKK